jgi:hypothetical protein
MNRREFLTYTSGLEPGIPEANQDGAGRGGIHRQAD